MDTPINTQNTQVATAATEALAPEINDRLRLALAEAETEERLFVLQQRKIKPYAESDLVPQAFRGKIGNCLIASEMARRMGANILAVMQNLYIVHGNPSWSAKFAISIFNTCGRFTAIKYRFDGEGDDYGCTAYATEKATGEAVESPKITWRIVKAEGWLQKNGSKWKTLPDLMFRYRAAAYLIATTAPELLNGLRTQEEEQDAAGATNSGGPIDVADAAVVEAVRPSDRLKALAAAATQASETAQNGTAETEEDADAEHVNAQAEIAEERERAREKARAKRSAATKKADDLILGGEEEGGNQ